MPTNFERAFAERSEVYAAWVQLNSAVKAGMDLRRYELATLAAAQRLRSSYCCLAHGSVLASQFGEPVRNIVLDRRAAGLDEIDVAVMDLAERVVADATSIGDADLRPLRDLGLTETEIMTSCSPRQRDASSRRRSTPWACFPTPATGTSSRSFGKRSSSAGPSPRPEAL